MISEEGSLRGGLEILLLGKLPEIIRLMKLLGLFQVVQVWRYYNDKALLDEKLNECL